MSFDRRRVGGSAGSGSPDRAASTPGKRTLVQGLRRAGAPPPARPTPETTGRGGEAPARDPAAIAEAGVAGAGGSLPRLDAVQRSFGRHDVSGARAHVGGAAAEAAGALGTSAFATGNDVAFAAEPDLFTVAHEAAHVVQQRAGVQLAGGIDGGDDAYEQHADRVAGAVVRGESAEGLLDEAPGGGAAGGAAVQRFGNRDRDRTERGQVWDPTIAGPLGDPTAGASDAAAIRANLALGLTDDKIRRLRGALGLSTRPRTAHAIDRDVVHRIRDRQGGGSGVLDEDTVFRLALGARWPGIVGPGRYRRTPPWQALDATQLAAIREHVVPALRVTDADLQLSAGRTPHAVVTERFIQQAVSWQFWHHAADPRVVWGLLDGNDLVTRLGVAIELPPGPSAPAPDAVEAPAPEPGAADAEVDAAEAAAEHDGSSEAEAVVDPAAAPATVAELRTVRDALRSYARLRRARRRDPAGQAALDVEWIGRIDAAHARAMELGVNNERIFAAAQARPHMKAQYTADAIREAAFGATLPPLARRGRGPAAPGAAPEAVGSAPALERSSAGDARRHIDDAGIAVDRNADGTMRRTELVRGDTGWEGRALPGGRAGTIAPTREVQLRAREIGAGLAALKLDLERWATHLEGALGAPETIPAVLDAFAGHLAAHPFAVPRTLRRPFQLALPRDLAPAQWASATRARTTARQWARALRSAIGQVDRQIALHGRYEQDPTRRNPDAIRVDLNRTGVRVTNNAGSQLGPADMHLDVQFAEAMLRFLEMLRGLGCTEMRTAGFLRQPISPDDTHPSGRACDITGFQFGEHEIGLRGGRRDPGGYQGGERRFSDWYNHTDRIGGQTYSQILHAITARMATYFNGIVGPGHNAAHDNHWHVQLTGGEARGTINAIQDAAPAAAEPDE